MAVVEKAYIEITSACNLRCKHCYNNSSVLNNQIDKDDFYRIVQELVECGCAEISISGGEPFMHNHIIDYIRACIILGIKRINIVTNGTLISQKILEEILKIDTQSLVVFQLSIEGSCSKEHDFIRGEGCFNAVKRAVELLQKNNIRFHIHSMLHKGNKFGIEKTIENAATWGAEQITFSFFKNQGRYKANKDTIELTIEEKINILKRMEKFLPKGFVLFEPPFYGYCPLSTIEQDIYQGKAGSKLSPNSQSASAVSVASVVSDSLRPCRL